MTAESVSPRSADGGTAAVITVAAVELLAGCLLVLLAARHPEHALAILVAVHAVAAVAVGCWALRPSRRGNRFAAFLFLSTAGFGPLAAIGVILSIGLGVYYKRRAASVEQWHDTLFSGVDDDAGEKLWRQAGVRQSDRALDQGVTAFLDIMHSGSVAQRQAVLSIIAHQFHPTFAPALRAALRDRHSVIRVQAATAMARIEHAFVARTLELEKTVREVSSEAAVLTLARTYDDHAFAGVLDSAREEECREKAADGYRAYLRIRPEDKAAQLGLARLCVRRGRMADAEPLLRELAAADPHSGAGLWLMECLYAQGRFKELRDVAATAPRADREEWPLQAPWAIELWASRERTA